MAFCASFSSVHSEKESRNVPHNKIIIGNLRKNERHQNWARHCGMIEFLFFFLLKMNFYSFLSANKLICSIPISMDFLLTFVQTKNQPNRPDSHLTFESPHQLKWNSFNLIITRYLTFIIQCSPFCVFHFLSIHGIIISVTDATFNTTQTNHFV